MFIRPSSEEYHANSAGYVRLVPEGDIHNILTKSLQHTMELLTSVTEEQGSTDMLQTSGA